ncbi:T9SS type A sorting domain-containing protein [candidate division KSB1 bacterium]|nr:T9SS type A sorting domain-containing protein [candidate division KSB1 bacterium]NIR68450.1 T9SS type A sorting domain-containing protein [candidate division KSB1 bacterium]NIS22682.1 T9SS type A sorting domain-containing protein [candidate division KSB1 bacterium]NIU28638.1 T9SS type A sorting domain-containing protein [candidate division KSB1 bacterium]NIU90265.1 T9SS type A sorting domain-containing protein [candidate division KSB1 bacterium]
MLKLLIILIIAFALTATAFGQEEPTFEGVADCQGCHAGGPGGNQIPFWEETKHAVAYDSVSAFVQQTARCLECHTTGWDTTKANLGADDFVTVEEPYDGSFNVTIDDQEEFDKKKNVQCESCHGPASDHIAGAFDDPRVLPPKDPVLAETCGSCHNTQHHPNFDNWLESKHAVADVNANPFLQNLFRNDPNCSGCHTFQGFLEFVGDTPADTSNLVPNIAEPPGDAAYPIVCATCHDPHDTKNGESQLRLPITDLCVKCHNPELEALEEGDEPHNTPSVIFEGVGAFQFDGFEYDTESVHQVLPAIQQRLCATCHVFMTEFDDNGTPDDPSDDILANTGHTFEPRIEACQQSGCHVEGSGAELDIDPGSEFDFDHRGRQTTTQTLLDSLEAKLANATGEDSTTQAFSQALFNLQFVANDKSRGVHNPDYAFDILRHTITFIDTALFTSVEPIADDIIGIPETFALHQNYPNPFNPSTTIRFDVPKSGHVKLVIFNSLGQVVETLVDEQLKPDTYEVEFNASQYSSGLYFYKLVSDNFTTTRKMLLLK